MPLFDYTGQLGSGASFQGTLEAESQTHAEVLLGHMGVRVLTLRPSRRNVLVAPLSLDEFTFFNEQLSALTKASLPLETGLRQLAADVGSRRLKRLLLDLANDLATGVPLEDALQRQRRRFPPQYPEVVSAGLQTGDLAGTLYGLTTHLRLKGSLRRSLLELAVYPALVLILAFVVSSFIMRAVVPELRAILAELIGDIGAFGLRATLGRGGFLFWLADIWPSVEIAVVALAALLIFGAVLASLPGVHGLRERVLRRIPGFAQVYWSSVIARFAHTSALAAFAGRPLPELVSVAGAASGSPALTQATRRVADRLSRGERLEDVVAEEPAVPQLWSCAVAVAAPRGDLPATLAELARTYETRAQHWANALRVILGPLLLFILALGLGGLIVSVLALISSILTVFMNLTSF